jgi:hypothetical protein
MTDKCLLEHVGHKGIFYECMRKGRNCYWRHVLPWACGSRTASSWRWFTVGQMHVVV